MRIHAAALVVLVACSTAPARTAPALTAAVGEYAPNATLVKVVDGDTIDVDIDGIEERVRLIGIDTPETKKPDTPVECGGPQASAAMARLALRGGGPGAKGRDVVLVRDPSGDREDRFGRVLAYVDADGVDLGERQVADGWATVYAFQGRRFQRRARYERAQDRAQAERRGSWSACEGDFHSSR